ncbi:uncharacterized protein LOC113295809 [Papaver somniferum]|uniref:uncharacterized protein LOC113295809 n=1 Tax=Papaver somniferum TaxID=3469 RepID=UPI000E6FA04B|nr:uncharacterized protein LOC113295809 [Papaver somniferum]
MSKAFDRLEWPFLLKVLQYFGFCDDFCSLVHQCISTTTLSVMLNGSPCEEFAPTRGIRQGDPLSPYLFILAMEFLSRHLTNAQENKTIPGVKVAALAPAINHLLFADDCLIFTQANTSSVNNLLEVLHMFNSQSAQVINFDKSAVNFSKKTKPEVAATIINILGVKTMTSKERYLGSPLIIGHSKKEAFKSIKECFESRFSTWSSINLSQAGRGTMIKHVLNSIPAYHMGTFKLPSNLITQLTSIERIFFWDHKSNRGSNHIGWQNLCTSKDLGGLAFRDLEKLNLALHTKLAWRICNDSDHLMVKILSSKYFKNKEILHQNIEAKNCSFTWNEITKGLKIVQQNYFMEINNGEDTKIWSDRWIPGMHHPPLPQNDTFRFYGEVAEFMIPNTNQWNINLLNHLFDANTSMKIQTFFIDKSKKDVMIWMPTKDGKFSVKSAYKLLTNSDREVQVNGVSINKLVWRRLWSSSAAHRIKMFAWKCIRDIHSTKHNLTRCEVVFQGVSLNPNTTVHKIYYYFSPYLRGTASINPSHLSVNNSDWKPPLIGTSKINVDASFDLDTNQLGTGLVLRDHTGTCNGIKGSYSNGALSAEAGECMAVREALSWAKEKQLVNIHIEVDAKLVIQSITGSTLLVQWENMNLIKEIKHLISDFNSCTFSFVGRLNNQVADSIAISVRESASNIEKYVFFKDELCSLLAKDMQNNLS